MEKTKQRYALLDGLRGVAALMVIWYHVFEGFATSPETQWMNHGHLAVDFFFGLSGFVIGYAYDERMHNGLTAGKFMLRRIIRLQPMVIIGAVLGLISYCLQGCVHWDGTHVATSAVMLSFLLALFVIPVAPNTSVDVRGNGEMYPLNGPCWSLFFEYIASIFYAIILNKLSTRVLRIIVAVLGVTLSCAVIGNISGSYHLGVGWTMADNGLIGGLLRVMFSFSMGMLLSRNFKPMRVRGAFWLCSALLIALLCVPYIGANVMPQLNAVYDVVCVIMILPVIIYIAASGTTTDATSARICDFCGKISYPVYIIHYPIMYYFYAWIWGNNLAFSEVWPIAVAIFVGAIFLAYLFMRYYEIPIRRYLTKKLNNKL